MTARLRSLTIKAADVIPGDVIFEGNRYTRITSTRATTHHLVVEGFAYSEHDGRVTPETPASFAVALDDYWHVLRRS